VPPNWASRLSVTGLETAAVSLGWVISARTGMIAQL